MNPKVACDCTEHVLMTWSIPSDITGFDLRSEWSMRNTVACTSSLLQHLARKFYRQPKKTAEAGVMILYGLRYSFHKLFFCCCELYCAASCCVAYVVNKLCRFSTCGPDTLDNISKIAWCLHALTPCHQTSTSPFIVNPTKLNDFTTHYGHPAYSSRCRHYVFALWFLSFLPRLISAVADWMRTILRHMMWP